MSYKEYAKWTLICTFLLAVLSLIFQLRTTSTCTRTTAPRLVTGPSSPSPSRSSTGSRFLSYQPPGNGWNNQRIALENALVLAKLLNRTLLVHPLAPHELGSKLKGGLPHGYLAYNKLTTPDLLPPSHFLDLELMSQVVAVQEVKVSHPEFIAQYGHLTWRNICHTPGFGFWVDQLPKTAEEVSMLSRQQFVSLGRVWRDKCPEEQKRAHDGPKNLPFIRYVSDLRADGSEMLYFEHGTLFGIHIRFTDIELALLAQSWVMRYVHYNSGIWKDAKQAQQILGHQYNAIQVRRKYHMDSKLHPSYWLERMLQKNFSKQVPVYVATNDKDGEWFKPFIEEGYRLLFSDDVNLTFPTIRQSLQNDFVGLHEQCLCMGASQFVGSPASTFNAFILRHRGEVQIKDQLMMDTLHTYWIGHTLD